MSRAFVKEPDGGEVTPDLPDRPLSSNRNFVTPTGLALIDAEVARLSDDLAAARLSGERPAIASALRDLRYWTARRASAELVAASESEDVRFGSTVTIEREDGRRQTFRITGEDEADPTAGTLSYVSPLARALIGKKEGDEIEFMKDTIVLMAVESRP